MSKQASKLPRLMSVKAVSEETTIPASTVYDAVYSGELEAHRFGRAIRVTEDEVHRWIERHREAS